MMLGSELQQVFNFFAKGCNIVNDQQIVTKQTKSSKILEFLFEGCHRILDTTRQAGVLIRNSRRLEPLSEWLNRAAKISVNLCFNN